MLAKELIYLFNEEFAKTREQKKNDKSLPFIIRAYSIVAKKLVDNFHPTETVTQSRIAELHITENMKNKLFELLKKKIVNSPEMKKKFLFDELKRIAGIGPQKAKILIDQGLKTVNDLKKPKWWDQLNTDTKTAFATQPIKKIPHEEINKIEPILTKYTNAKIILVGSYRRKMPTSRDIDVMLVSAKTSALSFYLKYLNEKIPYIYLYSKGNDKMSLVIEFDEKRKYKVDVFRTHPEYYYAHLLYSTGSKANNVRMRVKAKKMGLLLNQKGLWKNGERILGKSADERAYYKALNMPYLKPEERN